MTVEGDWIVFLQRVYGAVGAAGEEVKNSFAPDIIAVASVIATHLDDDGVCSLHAKDIPVYTKQSKSTVSKAIKFLSVAGLVSCEELQGARRTKQIRVSV